MTKREDFIAALERREPEGAVPLWELEFHIWNKAAKKDLVLGQEFEQLSTFEKERAIYQNAEVFVSVSEKYHFAGLTLPSMYWEIGNGIPAYYWLPDEWRYRQAKVLHNLSPELMLVANCIGILGTPMGEEYVEFAYRLYDAPDDIEQQAKKILQEGIISAQKFHDHGVEIGLTTSDLADNLRTYMNPRQLDRFVWPYLHQWNEELQKLGMYTILHSDGNLMSCLNHIVDSGVNCLQAIDPTAGMNIFEIKKAVGDKLCLAGNIDCRILLSENPEIVYEETKNLLVQCKEGGGFILGASNAVQQEVPIENYDAMIQAWRDYGEY
jgi:uroporphyrinogen decarboxylase